MNAFKTDKDLAIVILMGGESKRMGRDKAFVECQGKTFLAHQVEKLSAFNKEIYLSVNALQFEKLSNDHNCIIDLFPKKGPLGGIYSCLVELNQVLIFVPIDMPNAYLLIKELIKSPAPACFTMADKTYPFPLKTDHISIDQIKFRLNTDKLKLLEYIKAINVNKIAAKNVLAFLNVNNTQ